MKKNKERLNHGLHNEKVCNYLESKKEFSDWIITTAFYSALQFVSYKIFPLTAKGSSGKRETIENVDQYYNFDNPKRISKHALLSDLVARHCALISPDYNWLRDMSMTARYSQYQHDPLIAAKAMSLMLKIKKHCVTAKDIDS
jgi:hypothetical protein